MAIDSTASAGIAAVKTSGYIGLVAFFQYLNVPLEQFGILAALMLVDFITGIAKKYRFDKSQIKSHLAWLGAMKKLTTLTVVLSFALVLKGLGIEEHKYVVAVLAIFIAAEGYSIIQNAYAVRTGKLLPEFDVISIIIKALGDYLKERIEKAVKVQLPPQPEEKNQSQE